MKINTLTSICQHLLQFCFSLQYRHSLIWMQTIEPQFLIFWESFQLQFLIFWENFRLRFSISWGSFLLRFVLQFWIFWVHFPPQLLKQKFQLRFLISWVRFQQLLQLRFLIFSVWRQQCQTRFWISSTLTLQRVKVKYKGNRGNRDSTLSRGHYIEDRKGSNRRVGRGMTFLCFAINFIL